MPGDLWNGNKDGADRTVRNGLLAENRRTAEALERTGDLRESLYAELRSRIEETSTSAPHRDGDWIYRSRIGAGQQYETYHRRPAEGPGEWICFFDTNREADGKDYFDLGLLDVSPDGRRLAYAVDTTGDEAYQLRFRDLSSGQDLPGSVDDVSPEGEWDASGGWFYFLREDATRRPDRLYRLRPGRPAREAVRVHHEPDPRFHAGIYKSQDGQWLFAVSQSNETTELHTLRADDPLHDFQCFQPRRAGIQYWLEHQEGAWLIRTNEEAPDFQLLRRPVAEGKATNPDCLVPPRPGIRLEEVIPFRRHLVLVERQDGLEHIAVHDPDCRQGERIPVPDAIHDLQPGENRVYDTDDFLCEYSSPIRPPMTFRYRMGTGEIEVLRQETVPSGHDPDAFTVFRTTVPSDDGTPVPMTLIHRRDLPRNHANPAFLYGYGAYGETVEPAFRSSWLTWLTRGFVVAIAHVRGGGLLGEAWYQAGKGPRKETSFRDFLACARGLEELGLSARGHICIHGASAGGMLIGVALNRAPDWFAAAVATVPFVDCLQTMLDPSLPLTTFEYEEWGNPVDPGVREGFEKWSPCENVRPARYPPTLAIAALEDSRVPFHEAARWISLLRRNQRGRAPLLLHTFLDEGHAGASGRYAALRQTALEQAFILQMYHISFEGADMKSSTV